MNARKRSEESPRPAAPGAVPDRDDLRRRTAEKAYSLYLRRDRAPGHDIEDWLEAERQVREEVNAPAQRSPSRQRTVLSH